MTVRTRRAALLSAVLVGLAACGSGAPDAAIPSGTGTGPETGATAPPSTLGGEPPLAAVLSFEGLTNAHVEDAPTYLQVPPVGGDHFGRWANCGLYDEPVAEGYAVHSMEHGAVWLTYRPDDLGPDDLSVLSALVESEPYLLVSPWPSGDPSAADLPAPVMVSAWGLQASASSVSDPVVAAFVDQFAAGPQTPEPGAPCAGGVGDPSAP